MGHGNPCRICFSTSRCSGTYDVGCVAIGQFSILRPEAINQRLGEGVMSYVVICMDILVIISFPRVCGMSMTTALPICERFLKVTWRVEDPGPGKVNTKTLLQIHFADPDLVS